MGATTRDFAVRTGVFRRCVPRYAHRVGEGARSRRGGEIHVESDAVEGRADSLRVDRVA
jgi:hypothetical protein